MLSAFGRVFKTADLRRKLLFTLAMIVLYRVGTFIPRQAFPTEMYSSV